MKYFLPLILLLLSCPLFAEPLDPQGDAKFGGQLDRIAARDEILGLAVAVVGPDGLRLKRSYGPRSLADQAAVNSATRFRIASLSKAFAATTAALLAYEGKLDLSAPVTDHAPHFVLKAGGQRRATLEHALSHRLGLPPYAYDNLLEADIPVRTIFRRLGEVDPVCSVGDCFVYQNVAFSVIEPAIARAAGMAYERVVERRIFEPLGMARASFGRDRLTNDENWARSYRKRRDRWVEDRPDEAYYRVPSAGGVNASLDDMIRWLEAQMGRHPDILSPDVLAMVHRPRVNSQYETRRVRWMRGRVRHTEYGLGWRVYDYRGHKVIFHGGGVDSYKAQIAFLPDHGIGLVSLWNSRSCRGWTLLPSFVDSYLDLPQSDWFSLRC